MRSPIAPESSEADAALRNASWVMAQRGLQIAIGVLFALLVPRLMGPQVFGQYALVTSVSLWFGLFSGLGVISMMTRSVPAFIVRGDLHGLRKLVSSLLALRVGLGLAAGACYLALTTVWLRDIDVIALVFMAGSVFARTVGNICFTLFLGLNQAGRWALGDLLRRSFTLALVLIGFSLGGLRGACAGWFAANVLVLIIGMWMAREHIRWSLMWPDRAFLTPFLRTGAYFAGGNILLAIAHRTGESLVHLTTRDFTEVGYFAVAYGMFAAGTQALWHAAISFAPLLMFWNERGENSTSAAWIERLLAWMTVAAVAGIIAIVFIGDLAIAWVLGPEYVPAARGLLPLGIAFLATAVGNIGRLQALVANRPGISAAAAGVELAAFWVTGLALAGGTGSLGACVAVLAGATLNAVYVSWSLRHERTYSYRPAASAAALGLPVLSMVWFATSWPLQLTLFGVALAAYAALLLGTRVVTIAELVALGRSIRAPRVLR